MKTHWARHSEAAKEAYRPQPNGNVERTVGPVSAGGGARMFHRVIESSLPTTHLDPDQLGKPHSPHPVRRAWSLFAIGLNTLRKIFGAASPVQIIAFLKLLLSPKLPLKPLSALDFR